MGEQIGKRIGHGVFASVHEGFRLSDGKLFAIKVIEKSKIDEHDEVGAAHRAASRVHSSHTCG